MKATLKCSVALTCAAVLSTQPVSAANGSSSASTVRTTSGLVEGIAARDVVAFKGIPYAAAPTGVLRWRSPQPARPWKGVRKAESNAPACMQDMSMLVSMGEAPLPTSEDCLYLNVWKPERLKGPAPVMVWIHGGAFTTGGTGAKMFDGTELAKKGVIVVTVAYRLGAFGFLAGEQFDQDSTFGTSGNFGIEDQFAALRWVKSNISRFGGDVQNVTLFGESAGAMSVSTIAGSPATHGLFHKVIAQSGGSFAPARTETTEQGGLMSNSPERAKAYGGRFLAQLGAKTASEARALSADEMLKASIGEFASWGPNRDGKLVAADQYNAYRQGRYNHTPVLIGYNNDEGSLFVSEMTVEKFVGMVRGNYGASAEAILAAYPHASDAQALSSARRIFGDTAFGWPMTNWARLQAARGEKVYAYYNQHTPPLPPIPMFKDAHAFHGSELAFVFGNPNLPPWDAEDHAFSQLLMDYWTNFAKRGDPNGPGLPSWPAYTSDHPTFMSLDTRSSPMGVPNADQVRVLDEYYAMRRGEQGQAK